MATRRKARAYSTREKVLTLSQRYPQKFIARTLGVSTRTVRRWKNEGIEPASYKRAASRRLQQEFEREHKRVARSQVRDRQRHPSAPRLKKLRVLPRGTRRAVKEYSKGRATGRFRESEWINYDVAHWTLEDIQALLSTLRDEGRIVQLIFRIPKGAHYPEDAKGRKGRAVKKSTRVGSPLIDLSNMDDGDIWDFLQKYLPPLRILYVAALDKKPRRPRG